MMFDIKIYFNDGDVVVDYEGSENYAGLLLALQMDEKIKSVDKIQIDDIEIPRFKTDITIDLNKYNPFASTSLTFKNVIKTIEEDDMKIMLLKDLNYKCTMDKESNATFYAFDHKTQNYHKLYSIKLLGRPDEVNKYIIGQLLKLRETYGNYPNVERINIDPISETNITIYLEDIIEFSVNMIKKYGKQNFKPLFFTHDKFYYRLFEEMNVINFYAGSNKFYTKNFWRRYKLWLKM